MGFNQRISQRGEVDRRYRQRYHRRISRAWSGRRNFVRAVCHPFAYPFDYRHGDHAFPFVGDWLTTIDNPHNENYRVPMMIYNPRIKNPLKKVIKGNFYSLSIPTTILDLMIHTNSFSHLDQQALALRFAVNYEHAQSLLRPVKPAIRIFSVSTGGSQWVLDNGVNLRVTSPHLSAEI